MYVLDELWRGEITPSERGYRKDSPYAALVRQANETADIFYKELSPVGKKAYDEHSTQESKLADISECDSFIRGFRLGARMILDVVGDYDSPMVQVNEMGRAEE